MGTFLTGVGAAAIVVEMFFLTILIKYVYACHELLISTVYKVYNDELLMQIRENFTLSLALCDINL